MGGSDRSADRAAAEIRRLEEENAALRREVAALRRNDIEQAFMVSVRLLAKAAELHDEETGNHILRLDRYAEALARRMGLPDTFCHEIGYSAALHDVGKTSIDSALLRKRGHLTPFERREMELHTEYGYRILRQSDRLAMAAEVAWSHHERWDGGGYPRGLAGEAIPLAARIVTIADVYDALRSPRPYKAGLGHEEVCSRLAGDPGHFDPEVLRAFAEHHGDFADIYARLVDAPDGEPSESRPVRPA